MSKSQMSCWLVSLLLQLQYALVTPFEFMEKLYRFWN